MGSEKSGHCMHLRVRPIAQLLAESRHPFPPRPRRRLSPARQDHYLGNLKR